MLIIVYYILYIIILYVIYFMLYIICYILYIVYLYIIGMQRLPPGEGLGLVLVDALLSGILSPAYTI